MARILFSHAHLTVDGNREYEDGALLVNDEIIEDVFYHSSQLIINGDYDEINLEGKIVMPGFFDSHIHGCFSKSFNVISKDELNEVSYKLLKKGTTSFLVTLTNNQNLINELKALATANTDGSRFLGIHLEGPFINSKYKGSIDEEYIKDYDEELLNSILSSSAKIKQMTLAPENKNSSLLIDKLKNENIKVMLGHSGARQEDVNYYDGFTHLFNASKGLHHRETTLVNMAFNNTDKYVEVIADGVHLNLSILKLIYKNIRRDRIMLVSDAIMLAGEDDNEFIFENNKCIKKGNKCYRLVDNKLCGSVSFVIDEIKNMHNVNVPLTDILLMTSLNAYRFYNLDKRFGTLSKGKYSDIVVLNDDLDLVFTYARGKIINA